MDRIEISTIEVGSEIGVIGNSNFSTARIEKVVRKTATQITLSNGDRWSCSKYSGWTLIGASKSFLRSHLITADDARARIKASQDGFRVNGKVARLQAYAFKHLPEARLDELLAVLDAHRQASADEAQEKFQSTGQVY